MPSPKKKYPYAIYRTDNTYLIHDLTRDDYNAIIEAWETQKACAITSIGAIGCSDIRSIIEQRPQPQPKKAEQPANPVVDQESLEWLEKYNGQFYMNREVDYDANGEN